MAYRPQKLVTHYLYTMKVTIVLDPWGCSKRRALFESRDKHSITDESSVMTSLWQSL